MKAKDEPLNQPLHPWNTLSWLHRNVGPKARILDERDAFLYASFSFFCRLPVSFVKTAKITLSPALGPETEGVSVGRGEEGEAGVGSTGEWGSKEGLPVLEGAWGASPAHAFQPRWR